MGIKLSLRKEAAALNGGDKKCPGCGRMIAPLSVVCTHCGYDFVHHKQLGTRIKVRRLPRWGRVLTWGLWLGLLALLVVFRHEAIPALSVARNFCLNQLVGDIRQQVVAQWAREAPFCVVGRDVRLPTKKGASLRGIFIRANETSLTIRVQEGEVEYPVAALAETARIQLYARERKVFLEKKLLSELETRDGLNVRLARVLLRISLLLQPGA